MIKRVTCKEEQRQFYLIGIAPPVLVCTRVITLSSLSPSAKKTGKPLERWNICKQTKEPKGFCQFEIIINLLISSFRII